MLKFAVLGYGGRGKNYAVTAKHMNGKYELTSICDINKEKLEVAKRIHNLPDNMYFDDSDKFFAQGKLADYLFICTQDRQHLEHTMKALELGYDILLEKPISPIIEDCIAIEQKAIELGRTIAVCHVLRYTNFYAAIKQTIKSGVLGDIIAMEMKENVGYWHQAHSFIRGDWHNSAESAPMILAKCCHDLDIAVFLAGSECESVASFGHLNHFSKEHAPVGSTQRCLDGCKVKASCPYDADKIYLQNFKKVPRAARKNAWPYARLVPSGEPTYDTLYSAVKNGPFGQCVYQCNNDVVDYQVVQMRFKNKINCTLTMTAFSNKVDREIRVRGSMGELIADMEEKVMYYIPFGGKKKKIKLSKAAGLGGHGGGDFGMMRDLCTGKISTTISESIQSHLMALASEESRLNNGKTILIDQYKQEHIK